MNKSNPAPISSGTNCEPDEDEDLLVWKKNSKHTVEHIPQEFKGRTEEEREEVDFSLSSDEDEDLLDPHTLSVSLCCEVS